MVVIQSFRNQPSFTSFFFFPTLYFSNHDRRWSQEPSIELSGNIYNDLYQGKQYQGKQGTPDSDSQAADHFDANNEDYNYGEGAEEALYNDLFSEEFRM